MRPRSPEGHLSPNPFRPGARATIVVALTALALGSPAMWALAQTAPEADWSQYQGGPDHAGARSDGPQPPFRVRWTLPAPAGIALSAPIVVEDVAITVGTQAVYEVDLATGKERVIVPRAGGPLSPPAAAEIGGTQAVLFLEGPERAAGAASPTPSPSGSAAPSPSGSSDASSSPSPGGGADASSSLVAVSLEDGTELWRYPLGAEARSGVTVDGSTAYVGDQGGHVAAVALDDGSERWTADAPGRVDTPVAVADGKVFAVARDADAGRVAIVAFDASTGERAWVVGPQTTSLAASAVAASDGSAIVGTADRLVRALAGDDGAERWGALTLSFLSPATSPAVSEGSVYAADLSGGLYRFDATDGLRTWSHQLNATVVRGAPVISGGVVLLGLNDGRLVAVGASSGHLIWASEASPGLIGTIALAPDVAIAVKGGKDAGLIAFEHDPAGTLIDVPSPTELDPGTTAARYAIAAAAVLILVLVPGIALGRRFGLADLGEGSGEDELEGEKEDEPADEDEDHPDDVDDLEDAGARVDDDGGEER